MTRSPSPQRIHDDRDKDRDRDRSHREKSSRKDEYDDRDRHKRRRSRSRDRDRDDEHRRRERSDSRERRKRCVFELYLYPNVLRSCSRKRDKSEERKARKAEKKRIKEEEEARQVAELSVYSATDNPFHDVNLGQQFRWHKKNEKERKTGMSMADSQRRDAIRRQEAKEELERLNRRRAEREADQRIREEEELRMQRLQESAQMSEWLAKEGDFRLEQERNRAAIRIREKRAKAIDFLALNLKYVNPPQDKDEDDNQDDAGLEIDLDEPYNIFDVSCLVASRSRMLKSSQNLTSEQVEELHDDIERYLTLEQEEVNIDFWSVRRTASSCISILTVI